jgi:hypothetical protein
MLRLTYCVTYAACCLLRCLLNVAADWMAAMTSREQRYTEAEGEAILKVCACKSDCERSRV